MAGWVWYFYLLRRIEERHFGESYVQKGDFEKGGEVIFLFQNATVFKSYVQAAADSFSFF